MKNLTIAINLLLIILVTGTSLTPQSVDHIIKKDRDKQTEIIMKDAEHQRVIIEKFNKIFKRIAGMDPSFKLSIPIHPGYADDVKEGKDVTRITKFKRYFAYVSEPYNLKGMPDDRSREIVEKLRKGTRVEVLMIPKLSEAQKRRTLTKDWCLVRTPSRAEGYMPLDLLMTSPPSRKKRAAYIDDTFEAGIVTALWEGDSDYSLQLIQNDTADDQSGMKKMTVSASPLNVRRAANISAEQVGSLMKGDLVDVIQYSDHEDTIDGMTKKWAFIRFRSVEGWVFSGYLKPVVIKKDDDPAELRAGESRYVKSDLLRLRDAPGEEGTVITSVPYQKRVEITDVIDDQKTIGGKQSKWVEVKYEDYTGWVFGAFLSKDMNAYQEGDDISKIFIFPFEETTWRISSHFGGRSSPTGSNAGRREFHKGVDIAAPRGTPILAASEGIIKLVEDRNSSAGTGYGKYIIMEHSNGYRTLYVHMTEWKASNGQQVKAGTVIGLVGSTGRSTGPHLHFEIRANEEYIDPEAYIHAMMYPLYFIEKVFAVRF